MEISNENSLQINSYGLLIILSESFALLRNLMENHEIKYRSYAF